MKRRDFVTKTLTYSAALVLGTSTLASTPILLGKKSLASKTDDKPDQKSRAPVKLTTEIYLSTSRTKVAKVWWAWNTAAMPDKKGDQAVFETYGQAASFNSFIILIRAIV